MNFCRDLLTFSTTLAPPFSNDFLRFQIRNTGSVPDSVVYDICIVK